MLDVMVTLAGAVRGAPRVSMPGGNREEKRMPKSNVDIAKAFVEAFNSNRFDDVIGYCAGDCAAVGSPYVGLGINLRTDAGGGIVLSMVNPKGPSAGVLKPEDEILRVADGREVWEGPEQIKNGIWGPGLEGSTVEVRIRRGGETLDLKLKRGLIEGYSIGIAEVRPNWESFAREWPDHKERIELALGDGDLVALFSVVSGTNKDYGRSATWGSTSFMRFKNGRIVEIRGVDEELMQLKQIGYLIREPKRPQAG